MKTCNGCGNEYESKDKQSKFCSRSCSATFNNLRKIPNKQCPNCLIEFRPRLNINKLCSNKCKHEYRKKIRNEQILSGELNSFYAAKNYLIEQNNTCSICNMEPTWNGKPLKFILDHIDGDANNNHISNLRLVCHNCDSQLDTYKGKNIGKGRHYRRERYKNGKSF